MFNILTLLKAYKLRLIFGVQTVDLQTIVSFFSENVDLSKFHFPIPLEYKEEVERKIHAKKQWKATLRVDKEKTTLMRKLVKLEFNKWLAENGHEREIQLLNQPNL